MLFDLNTPWHVEKKPNSQDNILIKEPKLFFFFFKYGGPFICWWSIKGLQLRLHLGATNMEQKGGTWYYPHDCFQHVGALTHTERTIKAQKQDGQNWAQFAVSGLVKTQHLTRNVTFSSLQLSGTVVERWWFGLILQVQDLDVIYKPKYSHVEQSDSCKRVMKQAMFFHL